MLNPSRGGDGKPWVSLAAIGAPVRVDGDRQAAERNLMKSTFAFAASLAILVQVFNTALHAQEFNRETALVLAVQKVMPSVVSIKTEKNNSWGKKDGIGTGVLVDERGFVVTNRHVITGAARIVVALQDKSEVNAQVVIEDANNDLAILKLPGDKTYTAIHFGPGTDLKLCETVIAIGHPYGYTNTVTTGIISSLGREITMPGGERLANLTQHSACINPGNSGGPLLNINGELIGINVALREGAQGIAFALNADSVQQVLARHLSASKLSQVCHGLLVKETVVKPTGVARQQVVIEKVASSSPAADGGLRSGDVILTLAGRAVINRFDVERAFWAYKPGDRIEATVLRAGHERNVAMTLSRGAESFASVGEDNETKPGHPVEVIQTASQR
jgi:serine protease Do